MEKSKTHWRSLLNTEYLSAEELTGEVTVTIESYKSVQVYSQSSKTKEDNIALKFKELKKPMILTKRKAKEITKILGTGYVEDWLGTQITLYGLREKFFGDYMDVIHVKASVKKSLPELTPQHPKWNDAKAGIKTGGIDIERIRKSFILTDENAKLLSDGE